MNKIKLTDLIAPSFYNAHKDIKQGLHTHYWLKGGRGSTKSSFISIEIVLGIMKDAQKGIMSNALIMRRVKDTLSESVRDQIKWAIDALGVNDKWHVPEAKLTITYIPTGQVIRFKGADNPKKVKSTKVPKGYIKYLWYEEVDEFENKDKISTINLSILRGGPEFIVFYSFNPPESQRNWCNQEVLEEREDKYIHHSDYRAVPPEWLGEQFLFEAEHMKKVNPTKYEHDFLGAVTGVGREVFNNITIREITDDEFKTFDRIYYGVDWGYYPDKYAYTKCHFDAARRTLYILDEYGCNKKSNKETADYLIKYKGIKPNDKIVCDSAEPKSIADYKSYGLFARPAVKGPDSVRYKMKWLQSLDSIVIDMKRTPGCAEEFLNYEYEIDKDGVVIEGYPDKNNHFIDSVSYACEEIWRRRGR